MANEPSAPAKPASSGRIRCIDWLRGLAVFDMIMWHSSGLLQPGLDKSTLMVLSGLVSASFLFAAGFAIALVMIRASGDEAARRRRAIKSLQRIGEVLLVAFVLRLLTRRPYDDHWLIRIDILSTIAWSLLAAFPLMYWGASRPGLTSILFAILGVGCFAAWSYTPASYAPAGTPANEMWGPAWDGFWGNFVQPGQSDFAPIPWTGFVFLGAAAGGLASMGLVGVSLGAVFGIGTLFWCFRWHYCIGNLGERMVFFGGAALALYALEREANDRGWKLQHAPISWLELVGTSALTAYVAHIWLLYIGVPVQAFFFVGAAFVLYGLKRMATVMGWRLARPLSHWLEIVMAAAVVGYGGHAWLGLPTWPPGSMIYNYWSCWGGKLSWLEYWTSLVSLWVLTMGVCWGWPLCTAALKARWGIAGKAVAPKPAAANA